MAGLGGMKSNSEPGMIDPIFINSSFNLEFDVSFVDTPFDSGEGQTRGRGGGATQKRWLYVDDIQERSHGNCIHPEIYIQYFPVLKTKQNKKRNQITESVFIKAPNSGVFLFESNGIINSANEVNQAVNSLN